MWIITRDGFFSTVRHNEKPNHVLVRARRKEHLKAAFPKVKISTDLKADYHYRIVVPVTEWSEYLIRATNEMDYTAHFKEAMRDAQPKHLKDDWYDAVLAIWTELAELQPNRPYAGLSGGNW